MAKHVKQRRASVESGSQLVAPVYSQQRRAWMTWKRYAERRTHYNHPWMRPRLEDGRRKCDVIAQVPLQLVLLHVCFTLYLNKKRLLNYFELLFLISYILRVK